MPARAIDSATLTFGLVAIPVKIFSTSERSHEVHFHLIHEGCGERLRQQYVCPRHGPVERSEIAKGFELTRGNFVELSPAELDALEAVASDEIAIQEFVPADAVDPISVAHSYYLGPGKGGERAYGLFRDALAAADLVGIAAYSARGKQYIVELLPYQTGLAMLQLRYPDEIKPWKEVGAPAHVKPAPAELGLARRVIDHLRHATFDPSKYKDEVKQRVRALIASKAKGGEITAPPSVEHPPVTDLMAALKASLGAGANANGKQSDGKGDDGGARKPAGKRRTTRATARHTAHTAPSRHSSDRAPRSPSTSHHRSPRRAPRRSSTRRAAAHR
jgi:DNA end-binding protein Ku